MAGDYYTVILGIPEQAGRPPHFYDMLGISLFESDGNKIHAAGLSKMKALKEWQLQGKRQLMTIYHAALPAAD